MQNAGMQAPLHDMHLNRTRAAAFGSDAERYDLARPSYPPALVDDLMADRPARVLDVGCGTGKAARLLLERGSDVLGVEPDARMAAVARSHGVTVEVVAFEDWERRGRTFDLVMSGQAWHWVDPAVGPVKAAAALREGGRLAAFWNMPTFDDDARAALDRAFVAEAPELATSSAALGTIAIDGAGHLDSLRAAHVFTEPEVRAYAWDLRYSSEEWLALLQTHSDLAVVEPARRASLVAAVAAAIDEVGGALTVHYRTSLATATRVAG
jgi:SAM-dependent methyltransferase